MFNFIFWISLHSKNALQYGLICLIIFLSSNHEIWNLHRGRKHVKHRIWKYLYAKDFQEWLIKRKPYLLMISDEEMTLSQVLDDRFPLIHM